MSCYWTDVPNEAEIQTSCGWWLVPGDRDLLISTMEAEYCPWCGEQIEEVDSNIVADNWRDYYIDKEIDRRREEATCNS